MEGENESERGNQEEDERGSLGCGPQRGAQRVGVDPARGPLLPDTTRAAAGARADPDAPENTQKY